MKPAAEQTITPRSLLQASNRWVAAAMAGELRQATLGLRAGAQAVQRELQGGGAGRIRVITDLRSAVDRLDDRLATLLQPIDEPGPRIRLLPEREVAAAVSLLADDGTRLRSQVAPRAPRVTGRPGLIGVATLHLLLGHGVLRDRTVRADRRAPDRLRVQVVGGRSALGVPAGAIHAAVLTAVIAVLGGRLDLRADTDPGFEVPLEL